MTLSRRRQTSVLLKRTGVEVRGRRLNGDYDETGRKRETARMEEEEEEKPQQFDKFNGEAACRRMYVCLETRRFGR